jgi:RNA polymerase sigma-70 factor, ECF subfamily
VKQKQKGSPLEEWAELTQAAQSGDPAAFSELFLKLNAPILNYVYRIVGDRATAEDLTQDAFIRAHSQIEMLGPPWDFKSWIYRIAGNLALDHLRREKRFVEEEPEEIMSKSNLVRPAENKVEQHQRQQEIWSTLECLPSSYRQALILKEYNDLSYEEIGLAMECNYSSARQLVHRARSRFREEHHLQRVSISGDTQCATMIKLLGIDPDSTISPAKQRTIRKHVKSCEICQAEREDTRKVAAFMAFLPPLVPSREWISSVIDQIQAAAAPPSPPQPPSRPGQPPQMQTPAQAGGSSNASGLASSQASLMAGSSAASKAIPTLTSLLAGAAAGLAILVAGFFLTQTAWAQEKISAFLVPQPPIQAAVDPITAATGTFTPTALPSSTSTPTATATSTSTPVEAVIILETDTPTATATLGPPIFIPSENANCRKGPDTIFEVVGFLFEGESISIKGKNSANTWWYLDHPTTSANCWTWMGLGTAEGDLSNVPIIASPPTPTPIDTQAPVVEISHWPSEKGHPTDLDEITFTAFAEDNFGIARIEIWIQPTTARPALLVATCKSTNSCIYNGGPYSAGTLTYHAVAKDHAGNTSHSTSNTVYISYTVR